VKSDQLSLVAIGGVLIWCAPASWASDRPMFEPHLSLVPVAFAMQDGDGGGGGDVESAVEEPVFDATLDFGRAGTDWLTVGGGVAFSTSNTDYNATVAWHHFLADDLEFNLTLGGWYHDQEGDDAGSGSVSIGFRWHAFDDAEDDRWTAYIDAGIGLMGSSDEVPNGGSEVNFIPRAGVGMTYRLGNSANRLDFGVRWQHISNGSTFGADENPSRDSVMVYFGVTFPF
jgi:hypothetical protein